MLPHTQETSIRGLGRLVTSSIVEGVCRNKLPALLAVVALVVAIPVALGIRYDERPRYRRDLLPEIERYEAQYRAALHLASTAPTSQWRVHYFLDSHRRAVDVLEHLRFHRPVTAAALEAHESLIRYYELADNYFAILRTEMSMKPELDYLKRWQEVERTLEPIRQKWSDWVMVLP